MQRVLSLLILLALAISLMNCGTSSKGNSGSNTGGGSGPGGSGSGGSGGSGSGGSGSGGSGGSGSGGSGSGGSGSGGSGSGGSGGSGSGSGSSSSVAYAYSSNGGSIVAYAVNPDGTLTAVSGSPYAVSTQVITAQGALVTNGANLYAIAPGGTNLAVMPINKSTGSLSQPSTASALTGDPNSGDTAGTLSLDHTGQSLYVEVGLSDMDSGINVFAVGSSNAVRQTQFVPAVAIAESALAFTENNQVAYTYVCTARVDGVFGYTRSSTGNLTPMSISMQQPAPPITSPDTGYCPIGIAASAKGRVAIAWMPFQFASSVPVGNQTYVGIYNVNSDNSLTLVPNSGVTTASTGTLALNFDPTGTYLAVAGNGGVQTYTLTTIGTLTAVASPQDAGVSFTSVAWDKSNHVYATSSSGLYVWNANNGALSGAAGSPHPGGTALAVLPLK